MVFPFAEGALPLSLRFLERQGGDLCPPVFLVDYLVRKRNTN
jgi:hypothetical protein